MDVVLTANSPGEVATWLTPVVRELARQAPQARVTVFLPPCAFASGAEAPVVRRLPGVHLAVGPRAYLAYLLGRRPPAGFEPGRCGVVGFLGGDLYHAALLSRRLGYPAAAYVERRPHFGKAFRRFFVPDAASREKVLRAGVAVERVKVVGDLVVDAAAGAPSREEARRALGLERQTGPVLTVLPGSRPYEVKHALGFLLRTAELAREALGGLTVLVAAAPFVGPEHLAAGLSGDGGLPGVRGELAAAPGGGWVIRTPGGLHCRVWAGRTLELMAAADVTLALPGSNNGELAALGVPFVVALPLNAPEEIPLEGLAGLLGGLPLVGRRLKAAAVRRAAARRPLLSLPNVRAQRQIVPEVRGILQPEDVSGVLLPLLRDEPRRRRLAEEARRAMGPPGAARRVAEALLDLAEER